MQLGLQQHRHLRSRSDVGSRTKNRPPLAASLCTTHHDQPALPATAAGGLIATCCVDLAGYDLTRLGELMPHPVYAWRRWVQVLSPSRPQYQSLKPLLAASLEVVKAKGAEDEEDSQLMLEVTWEWIALDTAALDLANTVAVDKGVAHDLLAAAGDYQRWTQAAARSPELTPDEAAAITAGRPRLLGLREPIRAVLHATAADQPLPGWRSRP